MSDKVKLLSAIVGERAAEAVVSAYGARLRDLARCTVHDLQTVPYMGPKRAQAIVSTMELAQVFSTELRPIEPRIREPEDVVRRFSMRLRDLQVEQFWVLVLDSKFRVRGEVMISQGLLESTLVHPREVFNAAIRMHAAVIVAVHNHPSGDPTPSPEDRSVTQQLVAAGQLLDIPLHDHVIIGGDKFASFATLGLL